MILFFGALFGLLLGSFFNVLIYRIPRNESIAFPASHCPQCKKTLKPWHNIPLVSYLFLFGKCSYCKKTISIRYPLLEALTGILCALLCAFYLVPNILLHQGLFSILVFGIKALILLLLIPIAIIDYDHLIIPDRFSIGSIAAGIILALLPSGIGIIQSLLGLVAGGGTLLLIGMLGKVLFKKDSMGMGDIKLMAGFGALFGPSIAFYGIMFGSVIGAIVGVILIVSGLLKRGVVIPFGPFLAMGIWVGVFFGDTILQSYTSFLNSLIR